MKYKILSIVLVLIMTACAQVYFASPQPSKGTVTRSFIPDIQGCYSDSTLEVCLLKNALVVSSDTFLLTNKVPVGDQVLVKFYKNYYFASFPDSNNFLVYMANFYDNKMAVYTLNADRQSIDILQRFVKVDVIDVENEQYLVNPSAKEFDQIIENELFDVLGILIKEEE